MIGHWWTKLENISHRVWLVCFIPVFLPFLPSWAILPLVFVGAPTFVAMNLKINRERRAQVYDRGFKDGQDSVNDRNK